MALQQYTSVIAGINGATLTEAGSVTVARATEGQLIKTLAKGFAGISPGAAMSTIKIHSAVPSADFEFNPGQFMVTYTVVEVRLEVAGRVMTVNGFVLDDNFSGAVDSPSALEMTIVCEFGDWK